MNHAKTLTALTLAGLLGFSLSATAASKADYEKAAADATAAIKAAGGYEWRDTGDMMKAADKAAESGDYAKAIILANKAKRQGELAQAQAKAQAGAGPH